MTTEFFDSVDSLDAKRAYAAAGALEALFGPSWSDVFDPQDAGRALSDAHAKQSGLKWMLPNLGRTASRGITAGALVGAWTAADTMANGGAARLLVVPRAYAWAPSELLALPDAISRLRSHSGGESWSPFYFECIGSLALAAFPTADMWRWNWPLRLGFGGQETWHTTASNRAVDRGLAVIESGFFDNLDIALLPRDAMDSLEGRRAFGLLLDISRAEDREIDPASLIRASSGDTATSATLNLPSPDSLDEFITTLVYEISHNLPPDVALNSAWHEVSGAGLTPLLIAPAEGYFEGMNEARLERRVSELARDLRISPFSDEPAEVDDDILYAFDLDPSVQRTFADLGREIEVGLREGRVRFDNESDSGENTLRLRKLVAEKNGTTRGPASFEPRGTPDSLQPLADDAFVAGASPPDPRGMPEPPLSEAERFLDVAFFHGAFYAGDTPAATDRVAATEPLRANQSYTLEIAVRALLEGLPQVDPKPVEAPRRGRETVRVYADVNVVGQGAPVLEDRLLPLEWPFDTDATPAFFRMQTGAQAPLEDCVFEIRLLSADLQPIDHVELRFGTAPDTAGWTIERAVSKLPPLALPDETAADALLLKVSRTGDFEIGATLKRAGKEPLVVPFQRILLNVDIEALLTDIRDFWTQLVVGKMSKRDNLSSTGFTLAVNELSALGARAWRELFGDRIGSGAGTSEALGNLLQDEPLPRGSAIRVSLARNAESFVFPWSLLRNPRSEGDTFWGLEHEIEIARPGGRLREPGNDLARISMTIDPGFGDIVDHAATLRKVALSRARLTPAVTEGDISGTLENPEPSDVYYYFCHGMSAHSARGLDPIALKGLQGRVDEIEDETARRPWTLFLDRLTHARGGARMFTGASEITEHDLRNIDFFKTQTKPLIFLNMCHSADLMPGMSSGLTRVFLDRDAGAVIGTECPVTAQFADAFARNMLDQLLDGKRLGEALLESRRSFHQNRNPLALLYTVYGSANLRVRQPRA